VGVYAFKNIKQLDEVLELVTVFKLRSSLPLYIAPASPTVSTTVPSSTSKLAELEFQELPYNHSDQKA
jgi:hypothetical protein